MSEDKHAYAIETFKEIIRGRKALLEEWRLSDIERAKIKINISKLESAIKRLRGEGMELIFSSDDEAERGKGWYWQKYTDWKCSQSFKSKEEAMTARKRNELKWEE